MQNGNRIGVGSGLRVGGHLPHADFKNSNDDRDRLVCGGHHRSDAWQKSHHSQTTIRDPGKLGDGGIGSANSHKFKRDKSVKFQGAGLFFIEPRLDGHASAAPFCRCSMRTQRFEFRLHLSREHGRSASVAGIRQTSIGGKFLNDRVF